MVVWRYLADDREVGRSRPFEDQEAAEAWLTESWPGLVDDGVTAVALIGLEDGQERYRMSLEAE